MGRSWRDHRRLDAVPVPLPLDAAMVAALRRLRQRQSEERLAAGPAYEGSEGKVVVDEIGRPPPA